MELTRLRGGIHGAQTFPTLDTHRHRSRLCGLAHGLPGRPALGVSPRFDPGDLQFFATDPTLIPGGAGCERDSDREATGQPRLRVLSHGIRPLHYRGHGLYPVVSAMYPRRGLTPCCAPKSQLGNMIDVDRVAHRQSDRDAGVAAGVVAGQVLTIDLRAVRVDDEVVGDVVDLLGRDAGFDVRCEFLQYLGTDLAGLTHHGDLIGSLGRDQVVVDVVSRFGCCGAHHADHLRHGIGPDHRPRQLVGPCGVLHASLHANLEIPAILAIHLASGLQHPWRLDEAASPRDGGSGFRRAWG
jgi:hypothetical protein